MRLFSDEIETKLLELLMNFLEKFAGKIREESKYPRYMKKYQAVEYCNCSNVKFDDLVKKGLPWVNLEGYVRYDIKDIDKFMEMNKKVWGHENVMENFKMDIR